MSIDRNFRRDMHEAGQTDNISVSVSDPQYGRFDLMFRGILLMQALLDSMFRLHQS